MFLTCSYLFPGTFAPSVKELTAARCEDHWMLQGLLACVEAIEASQELMRSRLEVVNPAPVFMNLTQEEDKGGLGGPIFLAAEPPVASVDTEAERQRAQEELITELDHLLVNLSRNGDVEMSGEYTSAGPSPWGPEF